MLTHSNKWLTFFSKGSLLLATSLAFMPVMKAYAELGRISTHFENRPKFEIPQQTNSNHPGALTPYFNAGCVLHGVDDFSKNDSYFFCIDNAGFRFHPFWIPQGDYEGLDYNSNLGLLFASAGDDAIPTEFIGDIFTIEPQPDCGATPRDFLGPVMVDNQAMEEVDGIAFDNQDNMLGWAQEAGLFNVPLANLVAAIGTGTPIAGTMLLEQPGEVEDIEVIGDNCLVGLLNIDHLGQVEDGDGEQHPNHPVTPEDVNTAVNTQGVIKANYVVACPNYPLITPCEQEVITALQEYQASEIEAIEVLPLFPGDQVLKVLLGFHTNSSVGFDNGNPPPGTGPFNTLVLGILDVTNCILQTQEVYEIPRYINEEDNLDVEGLAMVCPSNGN